MTMPKLMSRFVQTMRSTPSPRSCPALRHHQPRLHVRAQSEHRLVQAHLLGLDLVCVYRLVVVDQLVMMSMTVLVFDQRLMVVVVEAAELVPRFRFVIVPGSRPI